MIIAIIGAPGTGKSFLAKKISSYFNAELFLEGEIDNFPKSILTKLEQNICDLEVFMWFRNKLIKDFTQAQKLSSQGKMVILDTFWAVDECYLNLIKDQQKHSKAKEIILQDKKNLLLPDKIIFLKCSELKIKELMQKRSRYFEDENTLKINLFLAKQYEKIFTHSKFRNMIMVNRENLDFEKEKDLDKIVKLIEQK